VLFTSCRNTITGQPLLTVEHPNEVRPHPPGAAAGADRPVVHGYLQSVRSQQIDAGVDPANIHDEVFGADTWLVA
jgi:hypothetical protein